MPVQSSGAVVASESEVTAVPLEVVKVITEDVDVGNVVTPLPGAVVDVVSSPSSASPSSSPDIIVSVHPAPVQPIGNGVVCLLHPLTWPSKAQVRPR
jgi:hypothetical protein